MASDKLFFFLFQGNPDLILRWLDDLPAVVLEAQMAADPGFLLRLYAETGRFLQQQAWSGGSCGWSCNPVMVNHRPRR